MTRNKTIVTLGLIALVSLTVMGCSDDSNPVVAATPAPDTAPPAVPSNLSADLNGSTATISWDANVVDSDLAGFLVQKSHYDDGVIVLVGVPTLSTSITDSDILNGISEYHVLAVDESGNQSAYATVQLVIEGSKTDYDFSD